MPITQNLSVLAIDPGPRSSGWALIQVTHSPGIRCHYARGGETPSSRMYMEDLIGTTNPNLVAVECPAGPAFQSFRVPGLLQTARFAGIIVATAEQRGLKVIEATAQQVRKVLAGKANATDDAVRDMILSNIFHAPQHHVDHVHDALAMGLLATWMHLGKASLPVPVAKEKKPRKASTKKAKVA